jgi:hypothetical protein
MPRENDALHEADELLIAPIGKRFAKPAGWDEWHVFKVEDPNRTLCGLEMDTYSEADRMHESEGICYTCLCSR